MASSAQIATGMTEGTVVALAFTEALLVDVVRSGPKTPTRVEVDVHREGGAPCTRALQLAFCERPLAVFDEEARGLGCEREATTVEAFGNTARG